MDTLFWLDRWTRDETGFHRPQTHEMLVRHWPALKTSPGQTVFVPLCGKSVDLRHLLDLGHAVTGAELSPIAIRQFLTEQALAATLTETGDMPVYAAAGLRLIEGDFFRLTPSIVGPVDAVYDRAALIAMPPAMQTRYAEQLLALTPASAPVLLITLDYDPAEMPGPPFATPAGQVRRLFNARYHVESLEQIDALADNPGLQNRGLTGLTETAWRLRPR